MNKEDQGRDRSNGGTPTLKRGRLTAGALAITAMAFIGGGLFVTHTDAKVRPMLLQGTAAVAAPAQRSTPTQMAAAAVPAPRLLEQGQPFSFANLVEAVSPAVVTVMTERQAEVATRQTPENLPAPFRDFFRQFGQPGQEGQEAPQQQQRRARAMGSGFIIDGEGFIVTNNHVVDSATKISVKLPDGREFQAKTVGVDPETDIALLRVEGVHNLPTVAFGDDRRLRVGDWVVAVGNPFGLASTVTAGIVSSIGRDIGSGPYTDYIQLDAPINQGNSGGPTFDLSGRVIGMNTAIFSPSGGSVGIGFAIPSSTVRAVVEQLKSTGAVARGWLGVSIQPLTPELATGFGIPNAKGAIIAGVFDDSPAARAGFKQGDVVLAINGAEISDERELTRRVGALLAGQKASFNIVRDGKHESLTATIAPRDADQVAALREPGAKGPGAAPNGAPQQGAESLGLSLMPLTPALRQQQNIPADVKGVIVTEVDPNSDAADKGLAAGNVIMRVGGKDVAAPADIVRGVAEAKTAGRDTVLLLVAEQRGQQRGQRFVALKVNE